MLKEPWYKIPLVSGIEAGEKMANILMYGKTN